MDAASIAIRIGLSALLVAGACGDRADEPPSNGDGPALMTLPQAHLRTCVEVPILEPACPTRIPQMKDSNSFRRARTFRSARGARLFFSEWSAPRPGITPKNAPPRFFHLNVHGGDLGKVFAFDWPSHEVEPPDPIPKKRKEAFLLGQQTWAGRSGTLVLAPSFPAGGIDGDHVIFRWTEENREYAISIHAWLPLQDTLTTLEAVVESVES